MGISVCAARSAGILKVVTRPIDVPVENPRSAAARILTGAPAPDRTSAWASTTLGMHGIRIKVTGAAEIELARREAIGADRLETDRLETANALSYPDEAPPPPRVTFRPPSCFVQPPSGFVQPPSGSFQPPSGFVQPPSGSFQPPSGFVKSVLAAWQGDIALASGSIRENARALPSSR